MVAAIGVVFVRHRRVRTRNVSGILPSPGASAPTPVDGGPGYCKITFTPTDHQGCHEAHMWAVKDGKIVVVGPTWPDGN
jgi:hypothetical protein